MEIVRKIQKLLRSKKAYSSAPLAVVIALAGMMFFVVLWQIIRLITISAGVKDAVQSAVIATSVGNYSNVYDGVREGYSGGYRFSGNSWRAAVCTILSASSTKYSRHCRPPKESRFKKRFIIKESASASG